MPYTGSASVRQERPLGRAVLGEEGESFLRPLLQAPRDEEVVVQFPEYLRYGKSLADGIHQIRQRLVEVIDIGEAVGHERRRFSFGRAAAASGDYLPGTAGDGEFPGLEAGEQMRVLLLHLGEKLRLHVDITRHRRPGVSGRASLESGLTRDNRTSGP